VALRLVDRLDSDLPDQLHRLYLAEWWTHRRDADDVRRMLEGSDVVIGLVDEEGDRPRVAGFTAELGELRLMRRGTSPTPP